MQIADEAVARVLVAEFLRLPQITEPIAMFKGRHFDRSVILLCIRWYLAYRISLRDLEEMMAERGIEVDHSTIHRWVVHFSPLHQTHRLHSQRSFD
ncbi:transposase-like protein [Bradyrhizobium japonicum]